jgi:DNA-binding GntR family transcriptional regulator
MDGRVYLALCLLTYVLDVMREIKIDHDSAVPVYRQLADALRAQIVSGDLPPGRRMPSETELEQASGLARGTIRKSIETLREDGLIITVKGKGSFVAGQPETESGSAGG